MAIHNAFSEHDPTNKVPYRYLLKMAPKNRRWRKSGNNIKDRSGSRYLTGYSCLSLTDQEVTVSESNDI